MSAKSDVINILVKSRWKDKDKMLEATKKQEEIKRKYGMPEKNWNSLAEIRKTRTSR